MPAFSWNEIHRAFLLLWERRPSGLLLYAAGGAVPWLLTGRNSGRLHANLIQRNFTLASQAGFDSMITAVMGGLSASDYAVLSPAPGSGMVGTLSPEVVRAAKERSAQNRDLPDLEALASLPLDPARYRRVKEAVSGMQIRFQG